jgi:thiol:disulfide interchange protein/DsbC/DsbD-like thiol-disulfide interchange protein
MTMMFRILFLLLVMDNFAARASDAIAAPAGGASLTVSQPHVTAELIPEKTLIMAGEPFEVALHLHADPGWHTYWINPGDAGLATTIKWTLPPGFTAGPIEWPTPEKHDMGGLMTYGYAGDVYLLTTIMPPKTAAATVTDIQITAQASWLVCKEECIPGKADLSVGLHFAGQNTDLGYEFFSNKVLFSEARERLPEPNTRWEVKARYDIKPGLSSYVGAQALWIQFTAKTKALQLPVGYLYFFPEQPNVLNANEDDTSKPDPAKPLQTFILPLTLQQNGEKAVQVSGVLVSDQPLIGNAKAVYIPAFPTDAKDIPISSASLSNSMSQPGAAAGTGTPGAAAPTETAPAQGPAPVTLEGTVARRSTATTEAQPLLIAVLGAAFVGGLILNLMPCVLPVLSLKVFSLMKHAGENRRGAWVQGAAFTAGVVLSFWVLAGLLIVLQSAGKEVGWGFQMQSPGFVLTLILLFFLLALNLLGVFELGSSLVGLDAKATGHLGGAASSFGNGALATLAATPCTAPFMGSALGFAAQQPAYISLLIFTFLALGMATPYLLLTIFPGALRFVPKPGAWMEAFKQFMGFLLLASVIYLVYVFGALAGNEVLPMLLFVLLLAGAAAWIYGRWGTALHSATVRGMALVLTAAMLIFAVGWGVALTRAGPSGQGEWQPWSPAAVDEALTQGRPVFVDFTAAWCLSCKVNEALALGTDSVKQAFARKDVALFRADWTHADPAISETLRKFNRDGVPLYLVYSPKDKGAPQVLPEVLTPGIVLDALKSL